MASFDRFPHLKWILFIYGVNSLQLKGKKVAFIWLLRVYYLTFTACRITIVTREGTKRKYVGDFNEMALYIVCFLMWSNFLRSFTKYSHLLEEMLALFDTKQLP